MQQRLFGPAQLDVGVIGQGTWNIDYDDWDTVVAALRRGIELGLTHIDTAELYGDGVVEEMVAEAIEGRRDEVFLVSKVMPENATRRGTIRACERTLERLDTDSLDCYLLHWPEDDLKLDETFEAFDRLLPGREDPLLGREQLRRGGPRSGAPVRRARRPRLQSGALPSVGAPHRARRAAVVRVARRRRDGVQPVRAWALPGAGPPRLGRARQDRAGARGHAAAGGARLPDPAAVSIRHPEVGDAGAHRRERRRRRPPTGGGRDRRDRRRVPGRPAEARAPDALDRPARRCGP